MITFTVPEAAKVARVDKHLFYRAIKAGELKATRVSPRRTLVWWEDVENWLQKHPELRKKPGSVA